MTEHEEAVKELWTPPKTLLAEVSSMAWELFRDVAKTDKLNVDDDADDVALAAYTREVYAGCLTVAETVHQMNQDYVKRE